MHAHWLNFEKGSCWVIKLHAMRRRTCVALCLVTVLGAACTSSGYRAPVEERGRVVGTVPAQPAEARPAPGVENLGKPGYVTVKPGDTLIRVAIDAGQNWRDVARWNNIENPDTLQVGQVLRVTPPATEAGVAARPITTSKVEVKPLETKPSVGTSTPLPSTPAAPPAATAPVKPTPSAVSTATAPAAGEPIVWGWPAVGTVGSSFEEPRNKGISILGKLGDPISASAFGRVIYVGALRGYGTIVLIKHNENYLSVYGNVRTALVREQQVVTKGQRIAEMGNSEAERVQVHFEIRRDGEAIDPVKLLPPR